MTICAILGSAFSEGPFRELALEPEHVNTRHGQVEIHRGRGAEDVAVIFRHGLPHRLLPHQINYRAQARALEQIGCRALLVTSSVGVLDPSLPLFEPLLLEDLLMLENRLPDGSTCTLFSEPSADQGHLVLTEGLFSAKLGAQLDAFGHSLGFPPMKRVLFAYVPGPRTKTRAENRALQLLGAQVNSMTLGPEVVLANELGIPCAGLVFGHKASGSSEGSAGTEALRRTLERVNAVSSALVAMFLQGAVPPEPVNQLYRFGGM